MNRREIIKTNNRSVVKYLSAPEITEKSACCLRQVDFIDFAIFFGSFAENRINNLSDIDIGVFINRDISLIERGALTSRLESALKKDVDVTVLNNLYKNKPSFAYEVISKSRMIVCNNQDKFVEFKKNTLLYFMDTANLRDMMDQAFRKRLNSGRFGERNYV